MCPIIGFEAQGTPRTDAPTQGLITFSKAHKHGTAVRNEILTLLATPDSSSMRMICRIRSYLRFFCKIFAKCLPAQISPVSSINFKGYINGT